MQIKRINDTQISNAIDLIWATFIQFEAPEDVYKRQIPDHTDDIKSTKDIPSWKRMCYCILKNDHTCRFMGFGLTRQEQKRVDIIRCKYGGMIDGK